MVKIALSSDNHFDINKIDTAEIIPQQVEYLKKLGIQYYLNAGDFFNDFSKTLKYTETLRDSLEDIKFAFIAGNHDMLKNVTYQQLEDGNWPGYLNNKFLDVVDTNYRIIGINGWYDYSFASNVKKLIKRLNNGKMLFGLMV